MRFKISILEFLQFERSSLMTLVYFKLGFYRLKHAKNSSSNWKKNPVHQTGYFKLENYTNQEEIEVHRGKDMVTSKCLFISSQFAGSQGRPDSRGPPLVEVHEPPSHQPPVLKASLGPVISNGSSVAPRIRQLQMQLSTTNPTINPTCAPRGSLV